MHYQLQWNPDFIHLKEPEENGVKSRKWVFLPSIYAAEESYGFVRGSIWFLTIPITLPSSAVECGVKVPPPVL
jgi:hypothetical protein